jgi:hypothetical protein
MQFDRLSRAEGKLARKQAVAGLALSIFGLFHIAMAGFACLTFHVGDQFFMDLAHMRIFKGLMTALAETDRVGAHGVCRGNIVPAVTVGAGRQIALVLGLEMPRVVRFQRCVAGLTVLGDLCHKLFLRLGRVRLVGVTVAPPVLVTIGTVDLYVGMGTVYRLF